MNTREARVSASDVEAAWQERRFRSAVDVLFDKSKMAGATGVPAMDWPNQQAIVGMICEPLSMT